jgi:glycosyltransferase involved in cell wall biosynthesis
MRIAQVSPLHEAVPPKLYGGTERVVSYLTEELVALGHDVTLFASGDSVTGATLVPACRRALRLAPDCQDRVLYHLMQVDSVLERQQDFDVIHFHGDTLHFPFIRRTDLPTLTTLHGRLDLPDLGPFYRHFDDVPVSSISNHQRRPLPWLNWRGTVLHGLPLNLHKQGDGRGGYLAFLGRISPEKGIDRAIQIARRTGLPLKVAAKVDTVDQAYFDSIRSLFDDALVEFIGEIGEGKKSAFLGDALALMFPIDWPEPFGLVMIEAMACGTPVLAFRRGSVPEVIDDGVTGCIVDSVDEAVAAMDRLLTLERRLCRTTFERRFSATRMANDYLDLYRQHSPLTTQSALDPVDLE